MTVLRRLSLLALVAVMAACSGANRRGTPSMDDPATRAMVEVTNQSWYQVVMYVSRGAQRIRLGDVSSQGKRTFRLPSGMNHGTIRFIADPVGSRQTARSFDYQFSPGQTLEITVPPSAFR